MPQTLGSRFNAIWHESTNTTHYERISLFVLTCSLIVILLSQGHVTVCKCTGQIWFACDVGLKPFKKLAVVYYQV